MEKAEEAKGAGNAAHRDCNIIPPRKGADVRLVLRCERV
jgi:hypothetical protein